MAPKFIIDINLPDTSAEDQLAACQRLLEEILEAQSATPLTVEPVEGEDNVGMDTRAKEAEQKPAAKASPAGPKGRIIKELYVIMTTDKAGNESIATMRGQPLVCGLPETHEKQKKALKANFMVDPAPVDLKFRCVKFNGKQELGALK